MTMNVAASSLHMSLPEGLLVPTHAFVAIGACLPAVRKALDAADMILASRYRDMTGADYTDLYHRVGPAAIHSLRNPHVSPSVYRTNPLLSADLVWSSILSSCLDHLKPRLADGFQETMDALGQQGITPYLVVHRPASCLGPIFESMTHADRMLLHDIFPTQRTLTASDVSSHPTSIRDTAVYMGLGSCRKAIEPGMDAIAIEISMFGTNWANVAGLRTIAYAVPECNAACQDSLLAVGALATFKDWRQFEPALHKAIRYSPPVAAPEVH